MASLTTFLKYTGYTLLLLFLWLLVRNDNLYGDKWRHRSLWMNLVSRWVPRFDIKEEWLLYYNEDKLTTDGLATILKSINEEAGLTKLGKVFALAVMKEQLDQRYCVSNRIKEKKRNKAFRPIEPKAPPAIVLGLPRTSTTFMHGLLAQDTDRFRAPRFHEYMQSCPPADEEDDSRLFDTVKVELQGLKLVATRWMFPSMSSLHHMDGRSPEEDTVPLGHEMVSPMYFTTFHLPSYMNWIRMDSAKKFTTSLKYLKEYLDIHLRRDPRQWVLKSPWHLPQVGELVEVFPGAQIVWMHRDPVDEMASLCNLVVKLISATTELVHYKETRHALGKETMDLWFWALQRGVEARKKLEWDGAVATRFADVSFDDLNKDSVKVVRAIYKTFGWNASEALFEKMQRFAEENRVGARYAREAKPSLSDFGLNSHDIRTRYENIMKGLELNFLGSQ